MGHLDKTKGSWRGGGGANLKSLRMMNWALLAKLAWRVQRGKGAMVRCAKV